MYLYWALLTRPRDIVPMPLVVAAAIVRAAEGGTWRHLEVEVAEMALPTKCHQLEGCHNMSVRCLGRQLPPNQEEGLGTLALVVPQLALAPPQRRRWRRRDEMMTCHQMMMTLHWPDIAVVDNGVAPTSADLLLLYLAN